MADFKYANHAAGMTIGVIAQTAASAIEAGDLVDVGLEKAAAADTSVKFLAMSDAESGAEVELMPLLNGTILKGTVNGDGGVSEGDSIGIAVATNAQVLDADASNSLFIALEDGAAAAEIKVLVIAGM